MATTTVPKQLELMARTFIQVYGPPEFAKHLSEYAGAADGFYDFLEDVTREAMERFKKAYPHCKITFDYPAFSDFKDFQPFDETSELSNHD